MCRLFGQISLEAAGAADFLVKSKYSLLRQSSCDRKNPQRDGWGLAWLQREPPVTDWQIEKSPGSVLREKTRFQRLAAQTKARAIVSHIRHASNPRKLPSKLLIGETNTQPFTNGKLIFAHNGTLNIPDEVAAALGDYKNQIRGNNDSEVVFWLFVKTWNELSGADAHDEELRWLAVFRGMLRAIDQVWESIPLKRRRFTAHSHGLNFIASNGTSLAAHCHYERSDGKSLCGTGRPYFEMCYNIANRRIIAASEPLDAGPGWKPIPNRHVLVAEPRGRNFSYSILPMQ